MDVPCPGPARTATGDRRWRGAERDKFPAIRDADVRSGRGDHPGQPALTFVVAIDGPAAAGKGTIARAVAKQFGFAHLDTGLLYRAVGRRVLDLGRGVIDEGVAELVAHELEEKDLAVDGLRTVLVSRAASKVAAIPGVRQKLLDFQRKFAHRDGGAVLDGRDIGTVACPDADATFYLTASLEARAERRFKELRDRGHDFIYPAVLKDMTQGDERDSGRASTLPTCIQSWRQETK